MPLSKDAILAASDLPTEEVEVPEWGGSVLVRPMTGRERDEFEGSMMIQRGDGTEIRDVANARAKAVVKCVVDEQGNRLFTDQDANALGEKSGAVLDRIMDVVIRLSKLGEDQVKKAARDFSSPAGNGVTSYSPSPGTSAKQ